MLYYKLIHLLLVSMQWIILSIFYVYVHGKANYHLVLHRLRLKMNFQVFRSFILSLSVILDLSIFLVTLTLSCCLISLPLSLTSFFYSFLIPSTSISPSLFLSSSSSYFSLSLTFCFSLSFSYLFTPLTLCFTLFLSSLLFPSIFWLSSLFLFLLFAFSLTLTHFDSLSHSLHINFLIKFNNKDLHATIETRNEFKEVKVFIGLDDEFRLYFWVRLLLPIIPTAISTGSLPDYIYPSFFLLLSLTLFLSLSNTHFFLSFFCIFVFLYLLNL